MASLFIKDGETNALAERLASRRGVTKTAAVKLALTRELERDGAELVARRPARDVLEQFWREHPLGESTGLVADKAFYDGLSDQEDD